VQRSAKDITSSTGMIQQGRQAMRGSGSGKAGLALVLMPGVLPSGGQIHF
jgi:hypothetical protein